MLTLCVLLSLAAIAGDSVNYWIGKTSRLERLQERYPKVFKKEHFEATNRYYAKYGGKTIIIARFVPYIRTFAPFLAGVGHMSYPKFLSYNIIGGIAWVVSFLSLGYFIVLISIAAVVYILFDAARFTAEERKAKREEKMVPAGEKPDER
jgi:membrane-associated protein